MHVKILHKFHFRNLPLLLNLAMAPNAFINLLLRSSENFPLLRARPYNKDLPLCVINRNNIGKNNPAYCDDSKCNANELPFS